MKFKFIGKPTLLMDTLSTGKIYEILQFEKYSKYLIVYLIDDNNNLLTISYITIIKFNEDWSYIGDE